MSKRLMVVVSLLAVAAMLPAVASASERSEAMERVRNSARVFQEIMQAPDKGIPQNLLQSAKCVAIIPGDLKFAFVLGGQYGRGIAECRTTHGWSAPMFIAVEGGSIGYQAGGSSTDLVLLFMNEHALHHLLNDEFKLGAGAAVAAGPVGRDATAATDISMRAEILSYSRSHGIFAGVDLSGTVVKSDHSADRAIYGPGVTRQQIVSGQVSMPTGDRPLAAELKTYSGS
ncbi:MAG TPA: lipid-binding SYLF domain-containing protein [Candidatus Acidoferrum sp.]|nr:lipid-binding SYLF domain-containing protein [Candidatus Acidoferrum sp.]